MHNMEDRYIAVTSSAFKSLYPTNQTFAFKNNILGTPIDNLDETFECSLVYVFLQNAKVRADSIYKVTVDFIRPYQFGDSQCQIIGSFYVSGSTSNQQTFHIQQALSEIKDAINSAATTISDNLETYTKAAEAERKAANTLAATCAAAHAPKPSVQVIGDRIHILAPTS